MEKENPENSEKNQFGKFQLGERLSKGQYSPVYQCFYQKSEYAIKIFPKQADQKDNNWLLREFSTLAFMNHPAIVKVIESGEVEGASYILMERIDGPSLDDVIKKKPLSWDIALHMLAVLTDGVQEIHQKGHLHQDIKPANIVVKNGNTPVIIDFGLAKNISTSETKEKKGLIFEGTLDYASPEQLFLIDGTTDERSDLFSLGVVFYEMLTGELPVHHPEGAVAALSDYLKINKVDTFNNSIPELVVKFAEKLLRVDPDERFESARQMLSEIKNLLTVLDAGDLSKTLIKKTYFTTDLKNLKQLRQCWGRVLQEKQRHVVIVAGQPGLGKSSLVDNFRNSINDKNVRNLSAACTTNQDLMFFSAQNLITDLMKMIENNSAISDLIKTLPSYEIFQHKSGKIGEQTSSKNYDAEVLASDLSTVLGKLLEDSCMIVTIEDIHWVDKLSRVFFERLVHLCKKIPILFIYTYRTATENQGGALQNFMHAESVIEIGKMPKERMDNYVNYLLGSPLKDKDFQETVWECSNGSPLVINEYLKNLIVLGSLKSSPDGWLLASTDFKIESKNVSIATIVNNRAPNMEPEVKEVIEIASMIGLDIDNQILEKALDCNQAELKPRLRRAVIHGVLVPINEKQYTFVHDLVRVTILDWISSAKKKEISKKLAQVFSDFSKSDPRPEYVYRAASYANQAKELISQTNIFDLNLKAGEIAYESMAFELCLKHLGECLELEAAIKIDKALRYKIYVMLGESALRIGQYDIASNYLDRALSQASTDLEKSMVYQAQGLLKSTQGNPDPALENLMLAFDIMEQPQARKMYAIITELLILWPINWVLVNTGFLHGRFKNQKRKIASEIYETAIRVTLQLSDPLRMVSYIVKHTLNAHLMGNPASETQAFGWYSSIPAAMGSTKGFKKYLYGHARRAAERAGDDRSHALCQNYEGLFLHWCGEVQQSIQCFEKIDSKSNANLTYWERSIAIIIEIIELHELGRSKEVVEMWENKASLLDSLGAPMYRSNTRAWVMASYIKLGRTKEAANLKKEMNAILENVSNKFMYEAKAVMNLEILVYQQGSEEEIFESIKEIEALKIEDFYFNWYRALLAEWAFSMWQKHADEKNKKIYFKLWRKYRFAALMRIKSPWYLSRLKVLDALYAIENKKIKQAEKLLDQAEKFAQQCQCQISFIKSYSARARLEKIKGNNERSLVFARAALRVAQEQGLYRFEQKIMDEFKIENELLQISSNHKTTHAESRLMTIRGESVDYYEVLLNISRASFSDGNRKSQTKMWLAELVKVLTADRGYVYSRERGSQDYHFEYGLDMSGREVEEGKDISTTVIRRVFETSEPLISVYGEDGEWAQSKSIVSNKLKSILCVPMVGEDGVEGVIYLDSRTAKGVFNQKDLELVIGISSQLMVIKQAQDKVRLNGEKKQMEQVLKRFFPESIVDRFTDGRLPLGYKAESAVITILFVDLCGFTNFMSKINPNVGATSLNLYLDAMIGSAFKYGGTVDKFIGDAVMVIFGAPVVRTPAEQASSAITCAKAMLEEIEKVNAMLPAEAADFKFKVRIGIHQGEALVGFFGSKERMEYTAIGHTVNVASRLEHAAEPNQILFSEEISKHIQANQYKLVGNFDFKGISQTMPCYGLVADR